MKIKKIAGAAAIAGAMGAAGLGLGAGSAQADQIWIPDIPGIPWGPGHWVDEWIPDVVPVGQGPANVGPPGFWKNAVPGCPPPGHWNRGGIPGVGKGPHSVIPCLP